MKVTVCPGTLRSGYSTYSQTCIKELFGGRKVDHVLPYNAPNKGEEDTNLFVANRKRISISGVQEKMSLVIEGNRLRLTEEREQGNYILKPIPVDLNRVNEVPANEHLTMQIAKQVFDIKVAENGLVFFKDGSPAYLTKRFDIDTEGRKNGVEDFASLAGKTSAKGGANFKYEYSYEEIGELIKQFVPAWRIEIEKYFNIVLFNYIFSNGDAHLKNFSILETKSGDYRISPAYDLINTRLHVDDSDFALSKGLFKDDFKTETHETFGHPNQEDFIELGRRLDIKPSRIERMIKPYLVINPAVEVLVGNSFLSTSSKRGYMQMYREKRNHFLKDKK